MKALYWEPPKPDELRALGLSPEDFPPPECELWPDNWPPISLFRRFATQWRAGSSGVYGLDYTVFLHELDRRGLDQDAYDEMVDALHVIEQAALDELRSK